MLDSLAPARRRLVLAVVGATLAILAGAVTAVVVGATRDGPPPVAQGDAGPVVLVAGYGGSVRSLEPIEQELTRAGRDVVVMDPVGGGTGDLDAQARALGSTAAGALARFDASSVDVVGYSAGGVVARSWVRDHGGSGVARRVLSIGSPQHGTTVAELAGQLGCPVACRQLTPDSDFLRALNAGDETPGGPVFVSVWSATDEVVLPAASAGLEGALDLPVQAVCPRARPRHGDLPRDPVVLALLHTGLSTGPPRAPGGDVCGLTR